MAKKTKMHVNYLQMSSASVVCHFLCAEIPDWNILKTKRVPKIAENGQKSSQNGKKDQMSKKKRLKMHGLNTCRWVWPHRCATQTFLTLPRTKGCPKWPKMAKNDQKLPKMNPKMHVLITCRWVRPQWCATSSVQRFLTGINRGRVNPVAGTG